MGMGDLKLLSEPQATDRSEYEAAVGRYVAMAADDDVAAIYQIGSVGAPGISDIDLIVILSDTPSAGRSPARYSIQRLSAHDRYLFMHDVYILPLHLAHAVHMALRVETIACIHGKDVIPPHVGLSVRASRVAAVACIIDGALDIMLFILGALRSGSVHVRQALCVLYSLRYTIALYEECGLPGIGHLHAYLDDVTRLRKDYFALGKGVAGEKIAQLGLIALEVLTELFQNVHDDLSEVEGWRDAPARPSVFYHDYKVASFAGRFHKPPSSLRNALRTVDLIGGRDLLWRLPHVGRLLNGNVLFALPTGIHRQLSLYANGEGIVAREVRRKFLWGGRVAPPTNPSPYEQYLADKVDCADAQAAYLYSNGFSSGQLVLYQHSGLGRMEWRARVGRLINSVQIGGLLRVMV